MIKVQVIVWIKDVFGLTWSSLLALPVTRAAFSKALAIIFMRW
jgi:hypothetical protein